MNDMRLLRKPNRAGSNLARSRFGKKRDLPFPRLVFLTDDKRVNDPAAVAAALPAGSVVIVRSQTPEKIVDTVEALRPLCRSRRVYLLAATDPRSARSLDVDGVHLSEANVRQAGRQSRSFPEHWMVTAAAHSAAAVKRAARLGADIILISPVFPTKSHPGARTLGTHGYRRLAGLAPDKACPLGGVTPDTLGRLRCAPLAAIAGIDLFVSPGSNGDDA